MCLVTWQKHQQRGRLQKNNAYGIKVVNCKIIAPTCPFLDPVNEAIPVPCVSDTLLASTSGTGFSDLTGDACGLFPELPLGAILPLSLELGVRRGEFGWRSGLDTMFSLECGFRLRPTVDGVQMPGKYVYSSQLCKSDVTRRNTLGYLYQYMCRGLRLWDSWDHEAVQVDMYVQMMETEKQSGPWSGPGKCNTLMPIMYLLLWLYITLVVKWLIGILTVLRWISLPNLETIPSDQGKWSSHAYNVFTLVVVYLL